MKCSRPPILSASLWVLCTSVTATRALDIQPGGFLALQSGSASALKAPWELAAGEFGVAVAGSDPAVVTLDVNLALADGAAELATARLGWRVLPALDVAAGRQDLPFARDRERFAAPDRPCIHATLTTEEGLAGGLSAEAATVTLETASGWGLEGWHSRAVFADRGTGQGLRVSRTGQAAELGLSLHHERYGTPLLAALDGRWNGFSGEVLARGDRENQVAWGWNLDRPWILSESPRGRTELLTGLENWHSAAGPGQWVTRLAVSRHFPPGVIARIEQRSCSGGDNRDNEVTMQFILPL